MQIDAPFAMWVDLFSPPPCGEGLGGGGSTGDISLGATPLPDPPPQGGRE
jgi:hypothetical protein